MQFKNYTIAPKGRNKFGNYLSTSNVTTSVKYTTYQGNTTTGGNNGEVAVIDTTNKYLNYPYAKDGYWYIDTTNTNIVYTPNETQQIWDYNGIWMIAGISTDIAVIYNQNYIGYTWTISLSKDSNQFNGDDLATTPQTDTIAVYGYRNGTKSETYVGNVQGSGTTAPANYGITGLTPGMTVSVSGQATTACTIHITVTSSILATPKGTLYIPIAVSTNPNVDLENNIYEWEDAYHKGNATYLILEYNYIVVSTGTGPQGRQGFSLRGPVIWDNTNIGRRWCNGTTNASYPEDALYKDIIRKDNVCYECISSYTETGQAWSVVSSNWQSASTEYDFVASNLLLAQNAKINFLTGNEMYLTNTAGTVTAGAAGGNGINFWAGSDNPLLAPFKVNNDGTLVSTKGTFGCLEIGQNDLGDTELKGQILEGSELNEIRLSPEYIYLTGKNTADTTDKEYIKMYAYPNFDKYDPDGRISVKTQYSSNTAFYTNGKVVAGNFKFENDTPVQPIFYSAYISATTATGTNTITPKNVYNRDNKTITVKQYGPATGNKTYFEIYCPNKDLTYATVQITLRDNAGTGGLDHSEDILHPKYISTGNYIYVYLIDTNNSENMHGWPFSIAILDTGNY